MSDAINLVNQTIDETYSNESAATRRKFVAGAAGVIGTMGLLGVTQHAEATIKRKNGKYDGPNTPENILAIAATAEVLATIVNTVGFETVPLDDVTKANIAAAAREELIHYQVLTSNAFNGAPLTKKIWVPNAVFESRENFLTTLVVGDQIFCNAYLIGVTAFGRLGGSQGGRLARIAAEFMGVEAVHRALALQSLGRLGNDRAFVRFAQREEAKGLPDTGQAGFFNITDAAGRLEAAGFGFGKEGSQPGKFYEFDEVARRTPNPDDVNTRTPR